jgi:dipeptidyl aminopeptidase/acylaminoacyl peptidase
MTEAGDPDVMNLPDALSVTWRPGDAPGRRLTYVERDEGADAVFDYRFDVDASERVVTFDERVSGRWGQVDWNADGTLLAYTRDGDVRVYDTETGEETTPAPSESFDSSPRFAPLEDRLAFVSGRGEAGNDVWTVDADGENLEQVTEGANPHDDKRWEPSWSPEGDRIAFVGAADWHGRDWADEAHVVHLATGEVDRLTRGLSVTSVPSWGPDGDRVAFFAKEVAEPWYRHSEDVHVHDLRGGTREVYEVEASHQYNVQQVVWDDDGRRLFFPVRERGRQQLASMLLHDDSDARGVPTRVTVHDGVFGAGPVRLSPDGEMLGFSYAEHELPPHPRAVPVAGGAERQLRDPPTPEGVRTPENVTYESFDGIYVNGYLYRPDGVDAETPAPALVQVHGGGHFQYGTGWHPIEQYLAANGFVVFAIDFRGSGGYGRAFQELSMGDWHGGQVDDAREAARFVRDQPFTTDDVGIYGGSWGGLMTLLSITRHPEVYDAAVEWYGVANQFTDYEEVDRVGRLLTERDMGGTPEEAEELYRAASASFRLDRVETPLSVLHGAQDERVPINQAEELIDELEGGDVPFEATIYDDEGHGFRDAANRRDAVETTLDWFREHLS